MIELKTNCYRGTKISIGNKKRDLINRCISTLRDTKHTEISIPIVQYRNIYKGEDKGIIGISNESTCLAPDYTNFIQRLSKQVYKNKKDLKLFYVQECFNVNPDTGDYEQFTRVGADVLNPTRDYMELFIGMSRVLTGHQVTPVEADFYNKIYWKNLVVDRGHDGNSFKISYNLLEDKVLGTGGRYDGGVGFSLNIDKVLKIKNK